MRKIAVYICILCALAMVLRAPAAARAAEALPELAPIVIAEVQPGTNVSSSQEFIELYNTGDQPIDLGAYHWRLVLAGTTATNWDTPYRTIALSGIIQPGQSYIVGSKYTTGGLEVKYLEGQASAWFSAGLSAGGGHLRLTYSVNQRLADDSCGPSSVVVDEVEWSRVAEGQAASPSVDGRSVFLATGTGIGSNTSLQRTIRVADSIYQDTNDDAADFATATPTPGVVSSAASTDSESGNLTPTVGLPADSCDPNAPEPPPAPSDGGSGVIDEPPVEEDPAVPNVGLPPPVISELLPNPASPQTDDADEFVELYNPGDSIYDISGFVLEAGEATLHYYLFPAGTLLEPHSYTAFFSSATGLSLSNSNGKVRLLGPGAVAVAQTDPYGTAADGQSWALIDGRWQWTTTPTPNAANKLAIPPPPKTKKAATAAVKKTSTTKAAATKSTKSAAKKSSSNKQKSAELASASALVRSPLHLGVLAAAAVFALLYGAYEYRHDMANKFRQLRNNRAARREARQSPAGRRDN